MLAASGFAQSSLSPGTARFQFREPRSQSYLVATNQFRMLSAPATNDWIQATLADGSTNTVELGSRIALHVKPGVDVNSLLKGHGLALARAVAPNVYILQAPNAWSALSAAQQLAGSNTVEACYPVAKRRHALFGEYAPRPNDPYFQYQWHLENRDANGVHGGIDVNARSAWAVTHGEGVVVAIGDEGVELTHPDLAARLAGGPHYNFISNTNDGNPIADSDVHGTSVAGMLSGESNNGLGIAGLASGSQLASWVIFGPNNSEASSEGLMDMFQYQSNIVSVQNHSWGNGSTAQFDSSALEKVGIANAINYGRGGKGVVMVRAAGNFRATLGNANDDGYLTTPYAIPVASVQINGSFASYSNPGANLLVAAPGGDFNTVALFTTDRQGSLGYNQISFTNDLADYTFTGTFTGTSAASPVVAGIASLILAANPSLTYRDVQQILILAASHYDFADPNVKTNGAGLLVSHNVGFGVPDAGYAVRLAKHWSNRPPVTSVSYSSSTVTAIPELSTQLLVTTNANTYSIAVQPTDFGPRADQPTASLPLVDVGQALTAIAQDLHGKAALIQRGGDFFTNKINRAAQAGASFAVIYDNSGVNDFVRMAVGYYSPIPAVFMHQSDGENLAGIVATNAAAQGQIQLTAATYSFTVPDTLACEHVAVTVTCNHPFRGDLRITLISPSGTVSVLQAENNDPSAGPNNWTYLTTHHFFESSYGNWTVNVSDEVAANTGSVTAVALKIYGVAITDSDHDGLDDNWETTHFGTLAYGPADDPDGDGYSNAKEQILGTNPNAVDSPLKMDLSGWNANLARLSWPGRTNRSYQVLMATNVNDTFTFFTNITGKFPETEFFTPYTNLTHRFFQLKELSP